MSSKSLITKLKVSVFLIAVIPIIIAALLSNIIQRDTLNQSISIMSEEMKKLDMASQAAGDSINSSLAPVNRLASSEDFAGAPIQQKKAMIEEKIKRSSSVISVSFYDPSGKPVIVSPDGIPSSGETETIKSEWVKSALSGRHHQSKAFFTEDGSPVMNYTVAVTDDEEKKITGALSVDISLTAALGVAEKNIQRENGLAMVTDEQGRVIHLTGLQRVSPDSLKVGQRTKKLYSEGYELSDEQDNIYLISSLPIPGTGMNLTWKAPVDDITSLYRTRIINTGGVVLLSLLMALLMSLYIARKVAKPLEQLFEKTAGLAKEISGESLEPARDSDELSALVETSDKVTKDLKNYLETSKDLYSKTRDRLETKVQELKSIHSVTEAFTTFKDFSELLKFISSEMLTLFQARFCCLYLSDEEDSRLRLKVCLTADNQKNGCWCPELFKVDEEPFTELTSSLSPIFIQDVRNEDSLKERFSGLPVGPYCSLPLSAGNTLFGVVEMGLEESKALTEGNIRLMVTLAKEASIAIENSRLYRQILSEKERLETVLSTISDGVITMDADYLITSFNAAAERITGFTRHDMLGKPCFELFKAITGPGEGREMICTEMECIVNTAAQQKQFPLQSEHTLINPRGKTLTMEFSTTIDRNRTSGAVSYFSVFRDISKVKELERLRADFIDTISHELRTPLTSIKGYVSTLLHPRAKFSAEETQEFLAIINEETNRLNRMINDLLEASKLHRDALLIKPQPFRISGSIEDLLLKYRAMSTKHTFITELENNPTLYGDLNQLEFVLNHLIENAVKFSPEGGNVKISLSSSGKDEVLVMIEDDGIGVPEEHREKIFNLFHRVDNRSVRRIYGPGLGLFISKKIVEAHGKRIWVESGLNGGAKFVFSIPRYQGVEPVEVGASQ